MKIDISNHNLTIGSIRPYTSEEVMAYLRVSKIVVDFISDNTLLVLNLSLNKRREQIIDNINARVM